MLRDFEKESQTGLARIRIKPVKLDFGGKTPQKLF
jgi:hypothetical protein